MKTDSNKVNRVHRLLLCIAVITLSSTCFVVPQIVRAQSTGGTDSSISIFVDLFKLIFKDAGDDGYVPVGPNENPPAIPPISGACSDTVKYPYAQYGLNYFIPIRDTGVQVSSTLAADLLSNKIIGGRVVYGKPDGRSSLLYAKTAYIDRIIFKAKQNGWNPAFILAIWLEETAGSASTKLEAGGACDQSIFGHCGNTHFGCNPGVLKSSVDQELDDCFFESFNDYFTNDKFANFMARYSGGSCTVNGGDIFKGICTGNPFVSANAAANNPVFPPRIRTQYEALVPQGTYGALETCATSSSPDPNPSSPPGNFSPIVVSGLTYYPQCSSSAVPTAYWSSLSPPGCGSYCSIGCGLASSAMIFSSLSGTSKDPKQFMDLYTQNGATNCSIDYTIVRTMFDKYDIETQTPVAFYSEESLYSERGRKLVDGYLQSGQTVLVYGTVSGYTHFVWIVGKDGSDYNVMDPYWAAPPDGTSPQFPIVPYRSDRYSSFLIKSVLAVKK